jgi:site-specific recombinase XerD
MPSFAYIIKPEKIRKDGQYNIYLRVIHNRKVYYRSTDIYVTQKQFKDGKVVNHFNAKSINYILQQEILAYEKILMEHEKWFDMKNWPIKDIVALLENRKHEDFFAFAESIVHNYIDNKQTRMAELLSTTIHVLKEYVNTTNLNIKDVNYRFIEKFTYYLAHDKYNKQAKAYGVSLNTQRNYLRNIKTVMNKAVHYKIISWDDYPFHDYKIMRGETKHKDLKVEQIRAILNYESKNYMQQQAVDVFSLTFLLVGINIKDLFYLEYNKSMERIEYKRAKTKKAITIKLEPEAKIILDRYFDKNNKLLFQKRYSDHKTLTKKVNAHLKRIAEDCGIIEPVSTYYARHSWATIATNIGISFELVGRCLGHTQKSITEVYINRDTAEIDEANRKVIDYVMQKD